MGEARLDDLGAELDGLLGDAGKQPRPVVVDGPAGGVVAVATPS